MNPIIPFAGAFSGYQYYQTQKTKWKGFNEKIISLNVLHQQFGSEKNDHIKSEFSKLKRLNESQKKALKKVNHNEIL